MNRTRLLFPVGVGIAAVVAIVIVTTSGSAKATQPTAAGGSAISIKQTSLGKTLADANGRTLYLFDADKPNVSTLSDAGRAIWPPFTASTKPQATGGAVAARIGTIAGPAGSDQVTYNGHPLYYYIGDQNPGQTQGQGLKEFGALWYVLSPTGAATTAATSSASAYSTPSGPGSGGSLIPGH